MPGLFVILSERDVMYRQIFLDGRTLPDDPTPTFNGYSVGRWDGDALVVTSNGFRDGMWLDRNGSPMSDVAKLTERYRRVNYGRLEIDVTLDDPKVYTRPWTVTKNYRRSASTGPIWWRESICAENNPHVRIGGEVYYVGADGRLMPAKKDQAPPDLKYFRPGAP